MPITAMIAATTMVQLSGWPLLDDMSKRALLYFREQSHPVTGFTRDRANNFGPTRPEQYVSSTAAIGFALAAFTVGAERGWMPRSEALARTHRTVDALSTKTDRFHGWYWHWINEATGAREWKSEVSTIDSALLFMGLIIARQGLKDAELSRKIDKIMAGVDWMNMLTDGGAKPDSLTIGHGYRPEEGYLKPRWHDYSEQTLLYAMAIGFEPKFPAKAWDNLQRNIVPAFGMQTITGGPLFMHQMSHAVIDFKGRRDRLGFDYWVSSRNITLMQRQHAIQNPKGFKGYGENFWGLSASDIPGGYGAQGFPGWGDDNGTVAPPAAVASVMFTPKESIAAAEYFVREYPKLYGRYGLSSGINPTKDWIGPDVIGIDQGQMFLAIESARDGLPQRLFMSHPAIRKGLDRMGFRKTSEGRAESRALRR